MVRLCGNIRLVDIDAITIPDAWFQCIYQILHHGRIFKIDKGSFEGQRRLEFDYITVSMSVPGFGSDVDINQMLPHLREGISIPNPVKDGYLDEYLPYLMTDALKPEEEYTYGQRLNRVQIEPEKAYFNQIEHLIKTYKNYGHRNNQMVLQIAQPSDMLLKDPPCLRLIDTRIQDDSLHFFVEFRSWDLWGGFPANLAAIEILKQYIASELNIKTGITIARSKGLHLYNYCWEFAELISNKTFEEAQKTVMA